MNHDHLAQWRDSTGTIRSYTSDLTTCLAPNQPKDFAAETSDGLYQTTFRCRDCVGCRNYEALVLRRRLALYFENIDAPVWAVEFSAPGRDPEAICKAIAKARPGYFLPGYLLIDADRIAKIRVGTKPEKLRICGYRYRQHKARLIARPSRAKAWKYASRGMRRPRTDIGANRNRYYLFDLPKIPKEHFLKCLTGGIRKSHPETRSGVRAWRRELSLYPSDASQGKAILAGLLAGKSDVASGFKSNRLAPKALSALLAVPETRRPSKPSDSVTSNRSYSVAGGATCHSSILEETLTIIARMAQLAKERGKT